jgi:hypothetical protein
MISEKNCYYAQNSYPKTSCFGHKAKTPLIKKRRRIIMKTNHLADWRRKRWRDVMWFRLTHTRYSRGSSATTSQTVNKLQSDESKVHERDEIYFLLYVCRLSITIETKFSFSLFISSLCLCWCASMFHWIFEKWKHQLNIELSITTTSAHSYTSRFRILKFLADLAVRSSCCMKLSFWDFVNFCFSHKTK